MAATAQRPYHHGDLPAALLAAVAEQVREGGAASVGLRETARRAGVSHAAPAHHFGDMRGLMTAFAVRGQELLGAALDHAAHDAGDDPATRLAALAAAYVEFGVGHPEHFAVMNRLDVIDEGDPALRAVAQPNFDRLLDAVRARQATGWLPDRAPLELAVMLWAAMRGLVELWVGGMVAEELRGTGPGAFAERMLATLVGAPS